MAKAMLVIDIPDGNNIDYLTIDYQLYKPLNQYGDKMMVENVTDRKLIPMPTKKVVLFDPNRTDEDEACRIVYEIEGYNRCVAEMLGETE